VPRSTFEDRERELIRARSFCHVATANPDGTIHTVIVWCDLDDRDRIVLNAAEGRRWQANARRTGTATLTIADAADPYEYVRVVARLAEATTAGADDVIAALCRKFTGRETFTPAGPGEVRVTLRFAPERVSHYGW
jgi:PPOX class probable F420-dependent enzyme